MTEFSFGIPKLKHVAYKHESPLLLQWQFVVTEIEVKACAYITFRRNLNVITTKLL